MCFAVQVNMPFSLSIVLFTQYLVGKKLIPHCEVNLFLVPIVPETPIFLLATWHQKHLKTFFSGCMYNIKHFSLVKRGKIQV